MRRSLIALGTVVLLGCGDSSNSPQDGSLPAADEAGAAIQDAVASTRDDGREAASAMGADGAVSSDATDSSSEQTASDALTDHDVAADANAADATTTDSHGCGAKDETCWGNPLTSQALLNEVASLGFKVVRIPVTWYDHIGPGPTYTIASTWMARVDTVVNYVLNAGLYAIVNVHHDGTTGGWLQVVDAGGNVTTANTQAVTAEFIAVWTQIATHFKSYDNRVVFESMNEVGHNPVTAAVYGVCNGLNQTFVTTVRGTGGNNASRFLDVPGHYTNIDNTVAGFVLPTDTIPNHLILTYHYYDPYSFTLAGTTHEWGAAYPGSDNSGQESWVVSEFDKMRSTLRTTPSYTPTS